MKFHVGLKYNRNLAVQCKKYLARGVYVLHPNMRTYVRLGAYRKVLKEFPAGEVGMKHLLKRTAGALFTIVVLRSGEFHGEILYITHTDIEHLEDRECRIFSNQNSRLMILANCRRRFELYLNNRKANEGLFPTPELYAVNEDEFACVEEYVRKVPITDTIEAAARLFEFYRGHYDECIRTGSYKMAYTGNGSLDEKCSVLYLQHGDLSIDNFMIVDACDRDLVFIDFEHEGYFPPFYDVFFFLFNQLIVDKNRVPLDHFGTGAFDKYLLEYAQKHQTTPADLVESCIRVMWNERLQGYSDAEKAEMKEVFTEVMHGIKRRMMQ